MIVRRREFNAFLTIGNLYQTSEYMKAKWLLVARFINRRHLQASRWNSALRRNGGCRRDKVGSMAGCQTGYEARLLPLPLAPSPFMNSFKTPISINHLVLCLLFCASSHLIINCHISSTVVRREPVPAEVWQACFFFFGRLNIRSLQLARLSSHKRQTYYSGTKRDGSYPS